MSELITIDISPDYCGYFNAGDGGPSELPDEVKTHPRATEALGIQRALEVWAEWFDTNDPHDTKNSTFDWNSFIRVGRQLAKELEEILGEGYEVLYYHRPLTEQFSTWPNLD